MRGLRLPLPPRKDPVLDEDELDVIAHLLVDHIRWARRKRSQGRVSEAIIRNQIDAEAALEKIAQVRPRTVEILQGSAAPMGERESGQEPSP